MTTSQAALIVGIHRNTLWNAIRKKQLKAVLIGNAVALKKKDVIRFRDLYIRGKIVPPPPPAMKKTPTKKPRKTKKVAA